jgi:alpha-amylase
MQNGTMLQYFHWYYPDDGSLWNKLRREAKNLSSSGFTAVWLPPAFKGDSGAASVGYDVYDFYDLGEFNQKGSVRTKYGTRREYISGVKAAHVAGLQVYVDIVVNHMAGADEKEPVQAIKVNPEDRNEFISEPYTIEAYTKFTFPVREKKYSSFEWNYHCFSGVDYDDINKETAIFSLVNNSGNDWEEVINDEKGNYDYLMYSDIEFRNEAVREELKKWGKWYWKTIKFEGVRLDAVKHISPKFYHEWLDYMRQQTGKEIFAVGEYWAPGNLPLMLKYIEATEEKMSLFDAALQNNFHQASKSGKDYDLSTIFNGTLVSVKPNLAVTVTDNHDTQPLQALEAPIEPWFKPIAYALILLSAHGYPCVFYPDLYGAVYKDKGNDGNEYEIHLPVVEGLEKLLVLRKNIAYGLQRDYFDHANCIGFTREGTEEHEKSGCAVLISNGEEGFKNMEIGKRHAGKVFVDYLQNHPAAITIDDEGRAAFLVSPGSVSVWVLRENN